MSGHLCACTKARLELHTSLSATWDETSAAPAFPLNIAARRSLRAGASVDCAQSGGGEQGRLLLPTDTPKCQW